MRIIINQARIAKIRQLQRCVLGAFAIWLIFIISFISAWHRVKDDGNFTGQPFNSFELDEPVLDQPLKN